MTPEQIEHYAHLAEVLLVPIAGLIWRIYVKISRLLEVQTQFPPHRHTNGDILYPVGMEPGKIQHHKTLEEI